MHSSAHAVGGGAYVERGATRPAEWRCDTASSLRVIFPQPRSAISV